VVGIIYIPDALYDTPPRVFGHSKQIYFLSISVALTAKKLRKSNVVCEEEGRMTLELEYSLNNPANCTFVI